MLKGTYAMLSSKILRNVHSNYASLSGCAHCNYLAMFIRITLRYILMCGCRHISLKMKRTIHERKRPGLTAFILSLLLFKPCLSSISLCSISLSGCAHCKYLAMSIRITLRYILMCGCRHISLKMKKASHERKRPCLAFFIFILTLLVAYSNSIVAVGFGLIS